MTIMVPDRVQPAFVGRAQVGITTRSVDMPRWGRVLLVIGLSAGMMLAASQARAARRGVFEWGSENIMLVKKLPLEFQTVSGKHYDLGYLYKRVMVLFIPVWAYGGRWCLYVTAEDKYLNRYDEARTLALLRDRGEVVPNKRPSLPFWDRVGGKLVWGGILLVILVVILVGRRKRERLTSRVDPKTGRMSRPPTE
jgi:hypothetical protein